MEQIYYFLSGLYGDTLHDFLLGNIGEIDANLFNVMFVVLLIISLGLIPCFYYKIWDRATWSSLGKWFLMLLINAVVAFTVNVIWVYCLRDDMIDEEGETLNIGLTNIVGFGFASAILATLVFFIASLIWKTQSTNCPNTPF